MKAAFFVVQYSDIFQYREMSGYGGNVNAGHVGQFADAAFSFGEHIQEKKARGMRKRFENGGA